jgi:hypothetical protein
MGTSGDHERSLRSTPTPIEPPAFFRPTGAPIELHDGPIAVGSDAPLPGRIYADLAGDLQVRWSVADSPLRFNLDDVTLRLERPDLGAVTVPARVTSGQGVGVIMYATVGGDEAICDRVVVHLTNLPQVLPWGSSRWTLSGAGWELTLDSRSDHSEVFSEAANSLSFVVTHAGELRKVDGGSFRASEAAEALEAFQLALSFPLGRYVAPVAPVGFDATGRRVWEQWATWRCDPVPGYRPWWNSNDGNDLKAFAELFLTAWFSSNQEREIVRLVVRHLIEAHRRKTPIEAKIMLVQAAVEYLSWVTYVIIGGRKPEDHEKGRDRAKRHFQELLHDAGIDMSIPSTLTALAAYAKEKQFSDGPGVLTGVRNKLVHPKDAGEPYRIEDLVTEAWKLVTEYGELLLLHRIGYHGKYVPRSDWSAFTSVPVPWST